MSEGKKGYHAPRLLCYGDVSAITQTLRNMGSKDGGSKNMQRTQ